MDSKMPDFRSMVLMIEKLEKEFLSCPYFYDEDDELTLEDRFSLPRIIGIGDSTGYFLSEAITCLAYARMFGKDLLRLLKQIPTYKNAYKGIAKLEDPGACYEGELVNWRDVVGKRRSPETIATAVIGYFKSNIGKSDDEGNNEGLFYDFISFAKTFYILLRANRGIDSRFKDLEMEANLYYDQLLANLKKANQSLGLAFYSVLEQTKTK